MPSLLSLALVLFLAPVAFAAGHELAPRPLGPSAYAQQTPLVAYAGGKYLTVWLESLDRAGWRYLGAFSNRDGARLSPSAFVVVPQGIAGPGTLVGAGDSFALFFPLDEGVQMFDIDLAHASPPSPPRTVKTPRPASPSPSAATASWPSRNVTPTAADARSRTSNRNWDTKRNGGERSGGDDDQVRPR